MNLVIISHTAHRYSIDGKPMGWGPTTREIDELSQSFDHVWHLAMLHPGAPPATFLEYKSNRITFVPLHPGGGDGFLEKLKVLWYSGANLRIAKKYLRQANAVQLRLPTGMGVYLLPWLSWFVSRRFILWVKYAGNWAHPSPTVVNRFQRWFLESNFQRSFVTINGRWPKQKDHCLSFENPCLTADEIAKGREAASNKHFDGRLNVLFVGRIEVAKGVDKVLAMVERLEDTSRIAKVVFAGDGDIGLFRRNEKRFKVPVHFLGGVNRASLNSLYCESHILLLPTQSEGFPKVVAEAAAFGCVPFVSNVSALGQYISSINGHLFSTLDPKGMALEFESLIQDANALRARSGESVQLASKFTYEYYNKRILSEIICLTSRQ